MYQVYPFTVSAAAIHSPARGALSFAVREMLGFLRWHEDCVANCLRR
jgi:hypothetical protein